MNRFIVALLVVLMPVAAWAQYDLSGKVVDQKTDQPLTGAHIRLINQNKTTTTDAEGEFFFSNLDGGKYEMKVSFIGYKPYRDIINLNNDRAITINMEQRAIMSDEVIISATRASERTPVTFENIEKEQIEDINLGQDIPALLESTPSVVTTSDAGAGIGYTGLRVRGTGLQRINVTINGVPLNDAESHGVFFVDLPDFSSSVNNIQIQRGVGTSTNGAAAFGASINIQSQQRQAEPYARLDGSIGSFNTYKSTLNVGTGLINDHWTVDARLSKISSDGYIDRAFSDLKSFYISGGYYGEKNVVKAMVFSGKERTYQAWYGVPEDSLSTNRTYNPYTYENAVDDYQQDHYQLHYSHRFNDDLNFNTALHFTHGEGYYENYKEDRSFSNYQLENPIIGNDTIEQTDLIQQKWLDNDFYGLTWSANYEPHDELKLTFGGAWNRYVGDHFGEVIWAEYSMNMDHDHQWYFNTGNKQDFNVFGKANFNITGNLSAYGDLQYRQIDYDIDGNHDDLRDLTQAHTYKFFNPKAGLYYDFNDRNSVYFSLGVAHREPNRTVFRDADPNDNPREERLIDYELGYKMKSEMLSGSVNFYYMDYKDQLVLTGEINNVGNPIMTNIEDSYRTGVEFVASFKPTERLRWDANLTLSRNRIKDFTAYIDNYDTWPEQTKEEIGDTDISFSPEVISGSRLSYEPVNNLELKLISKYVGKQYIDNTSSNERTIDPYFVNDINVVYNFQTSLIPEVSVNLLVNNVFDVEYETNAWVYRYLSGGKEYEMNGYFPQAGINFLAGVKLKF